MYKRLELYDSMIRLVEKYHKDLVDSTHLHLARQLEAKGKLKNAEMHFLAGGDWKSVVHMYCGAGRWEDGFRIAKQKGTEGASNQVKKNPRRKFVPCGWKFSFLGGLHVG